MFEIFKTNTFNDWLEGLRDARARARILSRISNMTLGNLGDIVPIGNGVSETRLFYGPGYRLYFLQDGAVLIVLLCGGDKGSQKQDIKLAKQLAKEWRQENG